MDQTRLRATATGATRTSLAMGSRLRTTPHWLWNMRAAPRFVPSYLFCALGRCVLVPHHECPLYPCAENDGKGWTATIIACTRIGHATVRYLEAATARGIPYDDVQLQLAILSPI